MKVAVRSANAARVLLRENQTRDAWDRAGFAIECALKAAVLKYRRLNRTPTKEMQPDFYTHNLFFLIEEAGISLDDLVKDPIAAKIQTGLMWRRGDAYSPGPMPAKMAKSMVQAACSPDGILAWITIRFRIEI